MSTILTQQKHVRKMLDSWIETDPRHLNVLSDKCYHGRSIPLVWTVEKGEKGHTSEEVQVELLRRLL